MDTPHFTGLSSYIKEKAHELGFDLCGIAKTKVLTENGNVMRKWCDDGMNGEMNYLARNIEKRCDPGILFPGAKSLVVTGLNYFSEIRQEKPGVPVLSRYAYGQDYHSVITEKLNRLLEFIRELAPDTKGKPFVDAAPLFEKVWAKEAGLGWQGRHSVVINEKTGSFFFIGILILNIGLEYDEPYCGESCGNCTLCIDVCPTGAINDNRTIDSRKCIANLTIEGKRPVPDELIQKMGMRVFGCDRCQEVCPWNKNAKRNRTPEFEISAELASLTREQWLNMSHEQFNTLFKDSPVKRTKYENFMENVRKICETYDSD